MNRILGGLFAMLLTVAVVAGCSAQDDPITTSSPTPTEEAPPLTASVVHTFFTSDPFARFAVSVTNPASSARVGVKGTWKALDADGVIVGTHDTELPPIAAGQTTFYVGGAGSANLTGTPARVTFEITDKGALTSPAPRPWVTAKATQFKRTEFDLHAGARDYEVTSTLSTTADVNTADINANVILKNKSGRVVGADWLNLDSAPASLARGDKVKVSTIVSVRRGKPATVEIHLGD